MGKCTWWKNCKSGCKRSEKLFIYVGNQRFESVCFYVFRLCGAAGEKENSNDNGRLGKEVGCFFELNEETILQGQSGVKAEIAKAFAESEFEKYRAIQDKRYKSDFDKLLDEI